MSYEKYCEVIDDVCEEFDIPDPKSNYEICHLNLENHNFSLAFVEADPEYLTVFCDFGEVPEQNASAILRRLLERNLLMFSGKSPRLSINPDTGHVLLIAQLPLTELTLDALEATLGIYAIAASDWRETFYLDVPKENETESEADEIDQSSVTN